MAQLPQSVLNPGGAKPHSLSLKVLRLSRPSLATSTPLPGDGPLTKASKPYPSAPTTNPFLLTPLLQLPPAFGAAYVGTTFSCTLCANNELPPSSPLKIKAVEISAELQTPNGATPLSLSGPATTTEAEAEPEPEAEPEASLSDGSLRPSQTLQKIVRHDLREDGQHVLAVTVSYTESRAEDEEEEEGDNVRRTFRKLYQFVAQPAIGVRTKIGELKRSSARDTTTTTGEGGGGGGGRRRKFVLEAQLENLTEASVVLDSVGLNLAQGLGSRSLNWDAGLIGQEEKGRTGGEEGKAKPVLAPQDVMQVAFVLEQIEGQEVDEKKGRVLLAQVHIDWRGPMGEEGELTTGWLGCKAR